jgi:hypothetical protein
VYSRGSTGLLSTYHAALTSGDLKFYGPTTFAYVISEATKLAREYHSNVGDVQAFVILLIITDGVIPQEQDFIATKEAVCTRYWHRLKVLG